MTQPPLTFAWCQRRITNALKYVAADANGSGQIEVEPVHNPTRKALLLSEQTLGKGEVEAGTGLGSRFDKRVFRAV